MELERNLVLFHFTVILDSSVIGYLLGVAVEVGWGGG
jgi:hypothetical protein